MRFIPIKSVILFINMVGLKTLNIYSQTEVAVNELREYKCEKILGAVELFLFTLKVTRQVFIALEILQKKLIYS